MKLSEPESLILGAGVALDFKGANYILSRSPWKAIQYTWSLLTETVMTESLYDRSLAGRLGSSHFTYSKQQFRTLLDAISAAQSPGRVYYWHSLLSHSPFIYTPQGTRNRSTNTAFVPGADPAAVLANYVEQVQFADSLLGRLLDKLKAEGLYDRATIIVTADHGLRTYGLLEPEGYPNVLSDLAPHVPLIIRAPGVKPGIYDQDYQHLDLAPTILDLLGLPGAKELHGVSAFAQPRPPRQKVFWYFGDYYYYDARSGLWYLRQDDLPPGAPGFVPD